MASKYNGWRPDSLDQRDLHYTIPNHILFAAQPDSVDLRSLCCPRYNQGDIGDCTSHAGVEAVRFVLKQSGKPDLLASRLFVYWNTRFVEGGVGQTEADTGATLRDTMKALAHYGVCDESEWPYSENIATKPGKACYTDAKPHKILKYERVPHNKLHIKSLLISDRPFVFGMSVYPSMLTDEVAATGVVPMPEPDEAPVGGHALLCCGYDAHTIYFQNSWGSWGCGVDENRGFGTLPWDYMLNSSLVGDMWAIDLME